MNESNRIFKAYLRILLRHLRFIQETLRSGKHAEAECMLDELIADCAKGLED